MLRARLPKLEAIRLLLPAILSLCVMAAILMALLPMPAYAQDIGDFRTHQTGDWNNVNTWERWDGGTWVTPAPSTPTSADGVITILNGHTVTVTAIVTVDQVTVNSGGQVTIGGVTLTVANGTGTDLQVNGTLSNASGTLSLQASSEVRVSGTLTVSGTGNFGMAAASCALYFNDGSTLSWNRNAGTLPVEAKTFWDPNSTCEIVGVTLAGPGNIGQSYGHFTWNSPSQTVNENLTTSFASVAGNFTVVDTGSGNIQTGTTGAGTITIGGNFIQTG